MLDPDSLDPDLLNPDLLNPVKDPDPALQVNTDPDMDPDPIRIQGFDDQKLKEKNTAEKMYVSPGLYRIT